MDRPTPEEELYDWLDGRFMPQPPAVRMAMALADAVEAFEKLSELCADVELAALREMAPKDPDIAF